MGSTPSHEEPDETGPRRAPKRSWRQRHPLVLGLLIGLGGTTIVTVLVLFAIAILRRPTLLTRAAYEKAAATWDASAPANYDLDLELGGRRPGKIHIEVRDGEITHMTRDGVEPKQKRTWYYWSVLGQLDTIEQELEMAEDPVTSYGAPTAADVVLWAEFDPTYGYPRRFDRVVLGADLEVHWKVTRFQPLPPEAHRKDEPPSGVGAAR